jgi:ubiquinone/menaquinone biosynthesis C-methylase UbiE
MRHYDETATTYDVLYKGEQEQKIREILKHVAIKDTDTVLDAGCGSGFLFEHVQGQAGHVVGVDLSRGLLKIALSRTKQSGMKKVSFVQADVDNLPLREHVFDEAFALTVLQDSSDYGATLKELKRTTKKNAIVVITGLKKTFAEESLKQALTKEGLEHYILKTYEHQKDIIAICGKNKKILLHSLS